MLLCVSAPLSTLSSASRSSVRSPLSVASARKSQASSFSTHLPWKQRFLLGFVSGDITVNLFQQRYPTDAPAPGKLSFLKGLVLPNWGAWQAGSIIGIFLGSMVPPHWGLGLAGTLAIICILVPAALSLPSLVGVAVAGAVAVWAYAMPYKLGLLAAVLVGMLCAMAVEEATEHFKKREKRDV